MATKKLLIDVSGKVKEISSSSMNYDDVINKITIDKMSFNTASLAIPDGLLVVGTNGLLSSSAGRSDGDIVSWDTASNKWTIRAEQLDISSATPTGDLTGSTYSNAIAKSLSNVTSGTLNVVNGGTGISSATIASLGTGSALLIGNGTSAPTLLKTNDLDLSKKPVLQANLDGTSWTTLTQSSGGTTVDVQIFNTPGTHTWTRPSGTKSIRVLAQGGGGGGGSGANRNSISFAMGGAGGGGGGFIDSGIFRFYNESASITVGSGGLGAVIPYNGQPGIYGSNGNSSSFDVNMIVAPGGLGGSGGSLASESSPSYTLTQCSRNIYDVSQFLYNDTNISQSNSYGKLGTSTSGTDGEYHKIQNRPIRANVGAGGAGVAIASFSNYPGGNGLITSADVIQEASFNSSGVVFLNTPFSNSSTVGSLIQDSAYYDNGYSSYYSSTVANDRRYLQFAAPFSGSGDITLEFVFKQVAASSNYCTLIRCQNNYGTGDGILFTIAPTQRVGLDVYNGLVSIGNIASTATVPLNSWNHIALVRKNKIYKFYLNGVNISGAGIFHNNNLRLDQGCSIFGLASNPQNSNSLVGYQHSVRIVKKALYDGNFIPPISKYNSINYSNSGSIISLNAGIAYSSSILSDMKSLYNFTNSDISPYSQTNDIFIASGGGGGASAAVTEQFDSGTLALAHINLSNPLKDNSVYNNVITTGSYSSIIASPVGLPSTLMNDGVLSSSYNAIVQPYTGSCRISNGCYNMGTGSFTYEGWYYLINTGSNSNVSERCDLATLESAANTAVYGLSISGSGELWLWDQTAIRPTGLMMTGSRLNSWNHVAVVRTGATTATVYVNATASSPITITSRTVNGSAFFGSNGNNFNPNGYLKEFAIINRAKTQLEIQSYYNNVKNNLSGSYPNADLVQAYPGGLGGNGAWGSGGGGGGASTNATSNLTTYDVQTVSLIHSNLSDESFKDKSIYNNITTNTNKQIVSTSSVGISAINSLMPDGVLSSSAGVQLSTATYAGTYETITPSVTDNFTLESWFYLKNSGSAAAAISDLSCYLLNAGYSEATSLTKGVILGIQRNTSLLRIWADNIFPTNNLTNLTMSYNQWNHVVMQKSGTNITIYLNGTGSLLTGVTSTVNTHFAYSLGGSRYQDFDYNGYAKEFVLTNRIKSASEIQDYYNAVKNNLSGAYSDPSVGISQGGSGGDGYVAVISYKY